MIEPCHLDRLRKVESGHVSDAMEEMGLRRSILLGFHLLGVGDRPIVGPAVTVQQARKTSGVDRSERQVRHREVSDHAAKPGSVVVIATGGILDVATWGENHSFRCAARGVEAMITDGAVRDVHALKGGAFPVFCRAFSPVKSLWDLRTESINEPVEIDGVPVAPGDVIFGDETGVVVIPADSVGKIGTLAYEIRRREDKYRRTFPANS